MTAATPRRRSQFNYPLVLAGARFVATALGKTLPTDGNALYTMLAAHIVTSSGATRTAFTELARALEHHDDYAAWTLCVGEALEGAICAQLGRQRTPLARRADMRRALFREIQRAHNATPR